MYIIIAIVIVGFVVLRYARQRKPSLTTAQKDQFLSDFSKIIKLQNATERLLKADSICSKALVVAGVKGAMGQQLRSIDTWYPRINNLWKAHKLRNRVAHEHDVNVSDKQVQRALKEFEFLLQSL